MYKQGDIIWVKYPFSDQPQTSKLRPAVVVSNEVSNRLDNDLLIAQITSALRGDAFSFTLTDKEVTGQLPKTSEVRCNKIVTIRQQLVEGKLSAIQPEKLHVLIRKVIKSFE